MVYEESKGNRMNTMKNHFDEDNDFESEDEDDHMQEDSDELDEFAAISGGYMGMSAGQGKMVGTNEIVPGATAGHDAPIDYCYNDTLEDYGNESD